MLCMVAWLILINVINLGFPCLLLISLVVLAKPPTPTLPASPLSSVMHIECIGVNPYAGDILIPCTCTCEWIAEICTRGRSMWLNAVLDDNNQIKLTKFFCELECILLINKFYKIN